MPVSKRKFAAATQKKGFLEVRNRDHVVFVFTDSAGKPDSKIQTKMSHGAGNDISDGLLVKMAKQMKFSKKAELDKFVECSISEEEYREMLRKQNFHV
ncbi:MAG TPA: hypothetical protein O0Y06_06510 [Methanocorpusculum sp.]|nr:hypothetical protein [Methanocorpusculum sp.]HJK80537.1 hypothetical protein [Methanocorpusculum sp.]